MNMFEAFRKQKKTHIHFLETVHPFLIDHAKRFEFIWPQILSDHILPVIPATMQRRPDLFDGFDKDIGMHVFFLSSIAVELNGARNVFGEAYAKRIELGIHLVLTDQAGYKEEVVSNIFARIHRVLDDAHRGNHNPVEILGDAIFETLGCIDSVEIGGQNFVSSPTMLGLGGATILLTCGWWKRCAAQYQVILPPLTE